MKTPWPLTVLLVIAGVILWFLCTRGWDEYGLWIAPVSALAMAAAQLVFWARIAPRHDRDD